MQEVITPAENTSVPTVNVIEAATPEHLSPNHEQPLAEEGNGDQAGQAFTPPEDKVVALRDALEAAISNRIFWENPKRYDRALDGLRVPVSGDRAMQQYYNHAKNCLIELAFKVAIENGVVPTMPTEDEILAEAKRRQAEKQKESEEKARRKAEKKS